MYVKNGSRLTYACTFRNLVLTSPGDLLAKIFADLANNHNITVEDSSNDVSVLHSNVDYVLKVLVSDTDYASELDVKSIIDHYFYTEGGEMPASSRIVSIKPPGGVSTDTGAPPTPPVDPADGAPPGWWDALMGKLEAGGAGVLFGVALVVGVIMFVTVREAVEG